LLGGNVTNPIHKKNWLANQERVGIQQGYMHIFLSFKSNVNPQQKDQKDLKMNGKLKHLPKGTYAANNTYEKSFSIKAILKHHGYNDNEIAEMLKDGRVLIARKNLRKGLKLDETLYVFEIEKEDKSNKTELDRFRSLDLE
jgi:hypothetical protein